MKKIRLIQYDMLKLFDKFIKETESGKRLQKNGKRIRINSVVPYKNVRKRLSDFSNSKNIHLRIIPIKHLKKRELNNEKKYWKSFYYQFTEYIYNDLNGYDNYVANNMKFLRAFFNYLNEEKELNIGNFHKKFYSKSETIEIIALSPEQLNYLIYDINFENSLTESLKRTKDIFVFGCTVALRVSDIFKLTFNQLEYANGQYYLNVTSRKTNTYTKIALPEYAVEIVNRQSKNCKEIFPKISYVQFNTNIKKLIEKANWIWPCNKVRSKRGEPTNVFKNNSTPYRFCDLVSTHTMRRTAITTMLCLNVPENIVRSISGHAPGSKEFYRYVEISQKYMDNETKKAFQELKKRKLVRNLNSNTMVKSAFFLIFILNKLFYFFEN